MNIKTGDVILLGDHKLLCGDSTKRKMVEPFLKGKTIDLILTDVPYGINFVESKADFTQGVTKFKHIIGDEIQTEASYRAFTCAWLSQAKPFMAKKNSIYIFNSDKMIFALREGMVQAGFKFSQLLIWAKINAVIGRLDYLPAHELIVYGWFGTHKFYKSKDKSVIVYPKPNKNRFHPTEKPTGLLRRLILNSSKVGDSVYEPFAGSGSCLIACEQTKRRCLAIEIDPEYCETIVMLWERLTGNKAKKL